MQSTTKAALCEARLPDGNGGRCIREHGHSGAHQTFVSEWMEGAMFSRRRQPPVFRQRLFSQDSGDVSASNALQRPAFHPEPIPQAAFRQVSFHDVKPGGRWAPLARRGMRTARPQL